MADRRTVATSLALSVLSATLVVAAVQSEGSTATNMRLDDGAVWVTNEQAGRVGRLNIEIDELDLAVGARGEALLQDGRDVFFDGADGSVTQIDVVTAVPRLNSGVPMAGYHLGGGIGAVHDPETGGLWVGSSQTMVGTGYPDEPDAVVASGSLVHVTVGDASKAERGRLLVVDEQGWYELDLDDQFSPVRAEVPGDDDEGDGETADASEQAPLPEPDRRELPAPLAEIEQMSSVGRQPVFLLSGGRVAVEGEAPVQIPGDSVTLQQAGATETAALVSSTEGLFGVPMSGGDPDQISAASGDPAAPVRVGPCIFGAWSGKEPVSYKRCGDTVLRDGVPIPDAKPNTPLVWRVNGRNVALNQPGDGGVWADHDGALTKVGNWSDVESDQDDDFDDDQDAGESERTVERTCISGSDETPIANDDELSIRPRPSIVDVLSNDDDANCEPIAIASLEPASAAWGSATIIDNAQHILITPSDELIEAVRTSPRTLTISYSVADAAGNESAPAQVKIVVKSRAQGDSPPELRPKADGSTRSMRAVVEEGRAITYNVMADWWDPDGDDLRLAGVEVEGLGQATATPDGTVRYAAYGVPPGLQRVLVTVTDGLNAATEPLEITVKPAGSQVPPVVEDDFLTVVVGQTGTVAPLANDSDPNESPLELRPMWLPVDETKFRTRQVGDVVEITGVTAGTYRLDYEATDGEQATGGAIFLRVIEPGATNSAPIAVPDSIRVRVGRVINVDVLANDVDLDGDLLGVASVEFDRSSEAAQFIKASVVERGLVQIELTVGPDGEAPTGAFEVVYTASDGFESERASGLSGDAAAAVQRVSRSTISVLVQPDGEDQPPVARRDVAKVRAGDVVSVPVLRNDVDPDADEITLTSVDEATSEEFERTGLGVVWTEGRHVWFQGERPGRHAILYSIEAGGKTATGEVVFDVIDPFDIDANPNRLPTPHSLVLRAVRNGTVRLQVPLSGVDPDGDSVTLLDEIRNHQGAVHGNRVTVDPDHPDILVFEAGTSERARDSFEYAVRDRFGGVGVGQVQVLVLDDSGAPPAAHDDVIVARPGRTVSVPVLANDTSPQDRRLELAERPFFDLDGRPSTDPVNDGVVVLDQSDADTRGRIEIEVPSEGTTLTEHYRISDGFNPGDAFIRVTPSAQADNLPPVANLDVVEPAEARGKQQITVPVLDNDYDPDDATGVLALSVPANQPAQVRGDQVVVELGERSRIVLYRITDADGGVAVGRISVPGRENHPPELSPEGKDRSRRTIEAGAPKPLAIELEDIVFDPDGDTDIELTDSEVRVLAEQGEVKRHDDLRGFTYSPPGELATTTVIPIQFEVTDRPDRPLDEQLLPSCGCRATLVVELVIEASSPPRVIAQGAVPVPQLDEPVDFDLSALVVDDQGDQLTYAVDPATTGPLSVGLSGSTLTIESTQGGDARLPLGRTIPIQFTVSDGTFEPVAGTVVVTIIRTNKGQPAAASFAVQEVVRDRDFTVPNLLDEAYNPFPDRPLKLVRHSTGTGASLTCSDDGDCVFSTGSVGSWTISYTLGDAVGQTANGTVDLVVKGAPRAPGVPRVESVGDHEVSLTWDAADMQGGEFEHYVVRVVGGSQSQEFTTTGGTFTGLTNGEQYRFNVAAVNELGEGEVSGPSSVAVPDRVPSAPTNLRFTDYSDGSLSMAWDEPSDAGDYTAIRDYEVSIGGRTIKTGGARSLTVDALQNGTDYDFDVRAQNSATTDGGWGPKTTSPRTERPSRYPDPPTNVRSVNSGDGGTPRLRVNWTPPSFDGGRALERYRVCRVEDPSNCQTLPAGTTEATFQLPRNQSSRFVVTAFNSDKNRSNSEPSAPSPATQTVGDPDPPNLVRVDSGDKTLTAVANATNRSGCSIENLQFSLNNGASWQGSPTFTGLVNGQQYTIVARAVLPSSCGTAGRTYVSGNSNAVSQTPYGPLQQPTMNVSRNANVITWTWSTNRADDGRPSWRATMSGECAGVAAGTGTYSWDYGYNSGTRTCTITISADGVPSRSASASASTPPPPPPPAPSINTTRGRAATGSANVCSGDPACSYVNVSGSGFTPGATLQVFCEGAPNWYSFPARPDGNGNFGATESTCRHGNVSQRITIREAANPSRQASQTSGAW